MNLRVPGKKIPNRRSSDTHLPGVVARLARGRTVPVRLRSESGSGPFSPRDNRRQGKIVRTNENEHLIVPTGYKLFTDAASQPDCSVFLRTPTARRADCRSIARVVLRCAFPPPNLKLDVHPKLSLRILVSQKFRRHVRQTRAFPRAFSGTLSPAVVSANTSSSGDLFNSFASDPPCRQTSLFVP